MIKLFLINILTNHFPRWVILVIDIFLVLISFIISYSIRHNMVFGFDQMNLLFQTPLIITISFICFLFMRTYKGIIRETGVKDLFNIILSIGLISLSLFIFSILNSLFRFSPHFSIGLSIILIHFFVSAFILTTSRFLYKSFFKYLTTNIVEQINVLIYGAGSSGIATYNSLKRAPKENYKVIGFIDDDENKYNTQLQRLQIYSINYINDDFIKNNNIKEIIISIQTIDSDRLNEITDYFSKYDVIIKIAPPVTAWMDGSFEANQIRKINFKDLLERPHILLNNSNIETDVHNKVILITGAAGSIGSEISKQLCSFKFKHLILIDSAESDLYELQQDLIRIGIKNFTSIVADIRDARRMESIFNDYKPKKIFHVAAYKHVPLMEENPYEAVKTNIQGTINIANLSLKYKIESFVLISTDKAVNPTNVMGATKRIAEMYINCIGKNNNNTRFTITRFGNVLGSNGSVIPLFQSQLERGGPLTVTHKEITRYFMTISEACSLVLEAGTMGTGGEIYVFDMGKSVKIFDLAKKIIKLSGYSYPEKIDIKITGLRPGEKLHEELLTQKEGILKTYHDKIMIAKTEDLNIDEVLDLIEKLCKFNNNLDTINTVIYLKKLVPEYLSNNSVYEKLDKINQQ